jgi:hypothetical protein
MRQEMVAQRDGADTQALGISHAETSRERSIRNS